MNSWGMYLSQLDVDHVGLRAGAPAVGDGDAPPELGRTYVLRHLQFDKESVKRKLIVFLTNCFLERLSFDKIS